MDYRGFTQRPVSPRLSSEALFIAPYILTMVDNCSCIENEMHIINRGQHIGDEPRCNGGLPTMQF